MNGTRQLTPDIVNEGRMAFRLVPAEGYFWECPKCKHTFTTKVGHREHVLDHEAIRLQIRPIVRYWVDVAQLPALVVIRREA